MKKNIMHIFCWYYLDLLAVYVQADLFIPLNSSGFHYTYRYSITMELPVVCLKGPQVELSIIP